MDTGKKRNTARIAIIGSLIVAFILVLGTVWMGQRAKRDTEAAVRSVSLLYLDELAGRREQVVESNLRGKIEDMRTAIEPHGRGGSAGYGASAGLSGPHEAHL